MSKLYIAYGSNLCKKQMRQRCPNARPLGKFMLTNAQLIFRGVADLEFVPGVSTPCGLYMITRTDEEALDRYEGIAAGTYFKSEAIELLWEGEKRHALIYCMNSNAVYPPSQHYADTIRRGYKDFDLDERHLDEAIVRSLQHKDPDNDTLARRLRQRATSAHREIVKMPESIALQKLDNRTKALTTKSKKQAKAKEEAPRQPKLIQNKPRQVTAVVSIEELGWINEHRLAFGRKPFSYLPDHVIPAHMHLIEMYAPFGKDPWGKHN